MAKILCKKDNGVAVITIDRPEALNALSLEIIGELDAAIDSIAADKKIGALIIGGTENFAAGTDIKGMVECTPEEARVYA